jgi:hypothetical protein
LYYKAVVSCFLDKLSDETGSKSASVKDLGKPQIAQIFADSGREAAGRKQEVARRSLVSSFWLLLENLWKSAVSLDLVAAEGRAGSPASSAVDRSMIPSVILVTEERGQDAHDTQGRPRPEGPLRVRLATAAGLHPFFAFLRFLRLERYGVYLVDVSPGNISFPG